MFYTLKYILILILQLIQHSWSYPCQRSTDCTSPLLDRSFSSTSPDYVVRLRYSSEFGIARTGPYACRTNEHARYSFECGEASNCED